MATARFILHPSDAVKLMQSLVSANGGETVLGYQNGEYRIAGIPCLISGNIAEGKLLLVTARESNPSSSSAGEMIPAARNVRKPRAPV